MAGMSQKEAQSRPVDDVLAGIEASISEMKSEIKGIKGQQALHRKALALPRPGEKRTEPETSPKEAQEAQSKPQEAPKFHQTYEWMRDCPECGGPNPDYKPATVACASCGVPLSSSPEAAKELKETKHTDKVKPCWNCGKEEVKILG